MSTNLSNAEAIKSAVRDHYGQAARGGAERSCCGDGGSGDTGGGDRQTLPLYRGEELAVLPTEIAGDSWGCGNPVALASLRPGEVVLDLGSGGGLDVLLAAQRVGPTGFAYGLDMTDEMLALARRNAARAGAANVAFLKGDIEAIPLDDATVDVIISNCVINLTPDKGKVLREAWRVLRPGGRLAISDIVIDGGLDGLPVSEEQIREALSWVGCIAGALTAAQYRELLVAAGFAEVDVAVQHRYSVADLDPQWARAVATLAPAVVHDLVGRFTSSAITARCPVES
ncbi:MAG: arsenite methyltransferase [Chloroflexi bacterium]|nr:arsenite methyltransferase [Chloroflexota bacterium]